MAYAPHYTTRTGATHTGEDKATITFDVANFPAAVCTEPRGLRIQSNSVTIGGSRFAVLVYPSGSNCSAMGKVPVGLINTSEHKVCIGYSIKVGDEKYSSKYREMKESSSVCLDLVDMRDVGWNLPVVVDITLLKEEGIFGKDDLKGTVDAMEQIGAQQAGEIKNELRQEIKKTATAIKGDLKRQLKESDAKMDIKMAKLEATLKAEIARSREPIKIPECPVCFEELGPPLRIAQCLRGHKICEPCSEKEEVKGCPINCKAGFMGRDHGMEAFVRQFLGEQE